MTVELTDDSLAILRASSASFPDQALTNPVASGAYLAGLRAVSSVPLTKDAVELSMDMIVREGLAVRVYRPSAQDDQSAIVVYFHGGGWVMGDLEMHDSLCRILANASHSVVVNVDYRLAPEHPFPVPLDDARAAAIWAHERAGDFGADSEKLVLMGSSAGGNLAAAVAVMAKRSGEFCPAMMVLAYPALDASMDTPSFDEFARGFLLERNQMRWFWQQYAPQERSRSNVLVSPARVEDPRDFPATVVVTAECDPLRDDGENLAERLRAVGRLVSLRRYDGQIHGFLGLPDIVAAARSAIGGIANDIRAI